MKRGPSGGCERGGIVVGGGEDLVEWLGEGGGVGARVHYTHVPDNFQVPFPFQSCRNSNKLAVTTPTKQNQNRIKTTN